MNLTDKDAIKLANEFKRMQAENKELKRRIRSTYRYLDKAVDSVLLCNYSGVGADILCVALEMLNGDIK